MPYDPEVSISGDITANGAKQFAADMAAVQDSPRVKVVISSGGGSVSAGLEMYETIMVARKHQHVDTVVPTVAFSMAAVVFQAGARRVMGPAGLLMLHLPSGVPGRGTAPELRKTLEHLDATGRQLANIVSARSKRPRPIVDEWLEKESWFDCEEAIAAGLADLRGGEASLEATAMASTILAQHAVPERYEIAQRAKIEALLADIEMDGNIARKAAHYSVFKTFRRKAVEAAERLTHMAPATPADIARAADVCDMLARAEDYPREVW